MIAAMRLTGRRLLDDTLIEQSRSSVRQGVCDCVRLSRWFVPPSWQWRNSCGPRPGQARSAAFFPGSCRDCPRVSIRNRISPERIADLSFIRDPGRALLDAALFLTPRTIVRESAVM